MISAQAASEIATKYYSDVYKVCMGELGNEDMASDVTQEVFLTFMQKLDELTYTEHIRAWLFKVAHNKLHEQYRYIQKIRDNHKDLEDIDIVEDLAVLREFDEFCYLSDDEIQRIKDKILYKLSPDERQLFNDIYRKHRRYREVGEELGISECAVSLRAFRLRKRINDLVEITLILIVFILVKLKS